MSIRKLRKDKSEKNEHKIKEDGCEGSWKTEK